MLVMDLFPIYLTQNHYFCFYFFTLAFYFVPSLDNNVADEIWLTDFSHKVFTIQRRNFDTFLCRFACSWGTTKLFIPTSGDCCLCMGLAVLAIFVPCLSSSARLTAYLSAEYTHSCGAVMRSVLHVSLSQTLSCF